MKVYFQWSEFRNALDVLFAYEREGADPLLIQPVEFVRQPTPEGHIWKPTFTLHRRDAEAFLKAAVEFADESRIKPESNAKLEGELLATKYHLEDLRALLKLKNP